MPVLPARISDVSTLPDALRGSAATTFTERGTLKFASSWRQNVMISASLTVAPGRGTTKAQPTSPSVASGDADYGGLCHLLVPGDRLLDLGRGKSPAVVFPDADVGTAAAVTMGTVTLGLSGQVCAARTRALVHRDALAERARRPDPVGDLAEQRLEGVQGLLEGLEVDRGVHPPAGLADPATGSTQCRAVPAMTASKRRPALSQASNVATSTSIPVRRANSAILAPG
jgi:hypothetical protein